MTDERQEKIPKGPNCAAGLQSQERIKGLEESDRRQWEIINKINETLNKRVPNWVMIIVAVLTAVIGFLARMAV